MCTSKHHKKSNDMKISLKFQLKPDEPENKICFYPETHLPPFLPLRNTRDHHGPRKGKNWGQGTYTMKLTPLLIDSN